VQGTEAQAFTVRQVAVMLNRGEESIRRAVRQGSLRAVRIVDGGAYLIPRSEIDRLLGRSERG